jgi:hypothetical protein
MGIKVGRLSVKYKYEMDLGWGFGRCIAIWSLGQKSGGFCYKSGIAILGKLLISHLKYNKTIAPF